MRPRTIMVVVLASAAVVGTCWVCVHNGDPERQIWTSPPSSGQPESRDSLAEVLLPRDARDTALARRPGEEGSDIDALIAGITGQRAYHRIQELMQRRDLSEAECEALCAFLAERTGNEYLERTASIKNSVMSVLAVQERLPAPWDQVLLKMFHDQEQHPVIRDYALQHLFSHYESMLEDAVDAAWHPLSRSGLLDEFWAAAAQVDQQSAGTALLGLLHLSGVEPAVEVDRLRRRSLDVLEDPQASELARISSLQVCASLDEPGAVGWAEAAAGAGQSIALRVSATAALGALGNPFHRQMLDPLTRDENPSVRTAAIAHCEPWTTDMEASRYETTDSLVCYGHVDVVVRDRRELRGQQPLHAPLGASWLGSGTDDRDDGAGRPIQTLLLPVWGSCTG